MATGFVISTWERNMKGAFKRIGALFYARTLELWRKALLTRDRDVFGLGFDQTFLRKWDYYFGYCEAGFRSRTVRNYQMLLSRMGEPEGTGRS